MTISQPGGPDVLRWAQVPDPESGPGDVLVEVAAAGVNRADVLQRQGNYQPPAGASPYPGLEVSGVVRATGADVTRFRPGDEVAALLSGGGYAELVAVPEGQLLPRPRSTSLVEAAALPEVACTVWSNIVDLAKLRAGETILIHGGGSGIGTFAIQLAKALGATVATTARPAKHAALRELGADQVIDYTSGNFADAVKADVILDIMGASYLDRNIDALRPNGRLVVIGLQGGRTAELNLGKLLAKRATVAATALRSRPPAEKAAIVRGVHQQVWPLVEAGTIRPIVDRVLPIAEAAEAHRVLEASDHLGKVLLSTATTG